VGDAIPSGGLSKTRIEALADGIFAIVMTLLIFDIKVPQLTQVTDKALRHSLIQLWPRFLTYIISFVMLGVYWVGHHNQYHYIQRTDRTFLWINILFFMSVTTIPFSTGLLGSYYTEETALLLYGLNLIVIGALLYIHWSYATYRHRLVARDIHPEVVRMAKRRILKGPAACSLAIAMSFINSRLSLIIYALVPLLYLVPGKLDRHWVFEHRKLADSQREGNE
jgi:uncharacterized membrane protein